MMYPIIPYYVGWPVVGILGVATFICLDIGIRKKQYEESNNGKIQYPLIPKKRLNASHRITITEIEQRMEAIHGHSDPDGLEADALDGILVSDLMLDANNNMTSKGRTKRKL